uniref:Uncharacterized protein n=1 Tax=Schizaphis graminum TaxID=13262 RepID=A0A2S2PLI1_SCHGA
MYTLIIIPFIPIFRCFLKTYKKYKSYYPVRYPKNVKKPLLCNVVHHSTGIKPSTKCSDINSTETTMNLEIICSTPNTKKVHSFEVNPLISPIKAQENHNMSIDSFCDGDSVLIQNVPKNNIVLDNKQIVTLPRILELSGLEMLNTSQQTLSSIEDGGIAKFNYSNNKQSNVIFISRDPNYFQHESYISKSNTSLISNVSSQEGSHNREEKKNSDRNTNSIYFENDFKKVEYKITGLKKQPILTKKEKSTIVLKQILSEKLKKNISLFKKNKWFKKSITSSSVNNTSNKKQINYNIQKSTSESLTKINETFNDILFSDFDITSQTQVIMKHNQSKNMHHNEIKDSSLKYYNLTGESNNSWNVETQNNNKEEDSILSYTNSSTKSSNKLNDYDHKIYDSSIFHSSLATFSDTSILSSNSTMDSDKLISIQKQFISWSYDNSNVIDYEENYTKQNGTVVFNNTLSEEDN